MPENPFAPPHAVVADVAAPKDSAGEPRYFAVSLRKLLLMNFGTLGLYQYYWFYRNWQHQRARTDESLSPALRTLFAVFFVYPLFRHIGTSAQELGAPAFAPGGLALLWILSAVLWKLPDPYWLVVFLSVFALVPVQASVNSMNLRVSPGHDRNGRLRGWNWVAIGLGLPFFALAVLGTLVPPPGQ